MLRRLSTHRKSALFGCAASRPGARRHARPGAGRYRHRRRGRGIDHRHRDQARNLAAQVPFSINAQTEEDIQRAAATTIEDLSRNVAGLTIQNLGPGQSQVAVRGVSAGQIVRDQPGVKEQVGVYLDESVVSLSLFTPDLDLFDLNRVETLRGPAGHAVRLRVVDGHGPLHHQPAPARPVRGPGRLAALAQLEWSSKPAAAWKAELLLCAVRLVRSPLPTDLCTAGRIADAPARGRRLRGGQRAARRHQRAGCCDGNSGQMPPTAWPKAAKTALSRARSWPSTSSTAPVLRRTGRRRLLRTELDRTASNSVARGRVCCDSFAGRAHCCCA